MEFLATYATKPFEFLWSYGLPFVLVLSVLVFVHEWGHYIVARMCGVRVEVFSIGFGRELFGMNDKHGTRWKFSLVPLGGYVQMFGDVDPTSSRHIDEVKDHDPEHDEDPPRPMTDEEKKVAFFSQPVWKRILIVFAGPAINFIFAIILLAGLYTVDGQPYIPPVAGSLMEGYPAAEAGIKVDDKFLTVNGVKVERFQDIVSQVSLSLDSPVTVEVAGYLGDGEWSDEVRKVTIIPEIKEITDRFGFRHTSGRIGIMSPAGGYEQKEHTVLSATVAATQETYDMTAGALKAIWQMISGTRSTEELGGIIRIGAYAGEFAQAGIASLITFAALLSINLGLINLFPIPLLDGGHLAFYFIEVIKGKPLSEQSQEYALRFGLAIVLGIMVFATWNDLVQMNVIDYFVSLVS